MTATAYDPQAAYLAADRALQTHYRRCARCRAGALLGPQRLCSIGHRLFLRERQALRSLEAETDTGRCVDAF